MKKQISTLVLALVISGAMVSCKKTYECHCDKVGGGDEHFDIKAKKDDAESQCKAKFESNKTLYKDCHLD